MRRIVSRLVLIMLMILRLLVLLSGLALVMLLRLS